MYIGSSWLLHVHVLGGSAIDGYVCLNSHLCEDRRTHLSVLHPLIL